jgi:hypothetical protein
MALRFVPQLKVNLPFVAALILTSGRYSVLRRGLADDNPCAMWSFVALLSFWSRSVRDGR